MGLALALEYNIGAIVAVSAKLMLYCNPTDIKFGIKMYSTFLLVGNCYFGYLCNV